MFFSWNDVLCEDVDVVVSVRADLLVVEAQGVVNLVLHRGAVQAAVSHQGHQLSSALPSQVGPTPISGVEVKEVIMIPVPPNKANACGLVEAYQASDDYITLCSGVSRGDMDGNVDIISRFGPFAAGGRTWVCIPLSAWCNVTMDQRHLYVSVCFGDDFGDVVLIDLVFTVIGSQRNSGHREEDEEEENWNHVAFLLQGAL